MNEKICTKKQPTRCHLFLNFCKTLRVYMGTIPPLSFLPQIFLCHTDTNLLTHQNISIVKPPSMFCCCCFLVISNFVEGIRMCFLNQYHYVFSQHMHGMVVFINSWIANLKTYYATADNNSNESIFSFCVSLIKNFLGFGRSPGFDLQNKPKYLLCDII